MLFQQIQLNPLVGLCEYFMSDFHREINIAAKENYPADLLDKLYSTQIIFECLQQFVAEARRADGTYYPPRTLFQLLSGLL